MIVMEWIKKLTDIIMPPEPPGEEEEDVKESKKVEFKAEAKTKAEEPQPAQAPPIQQQQAAQQTAQSFQAEKQAAVGGMAQGFAHGTMGGFARNNSRVSTSESGVTSMDGIRYETFTSESASVRPSLAVVKTAQITMKIYTPTKYDEQTKAIGTDLIKRNAIVVNYEGVNEADQQRIGDFVLGVVYTINGRVEMISNKIVLYVPEGFDVEPAHSAVSSSMRRYN